VNRAILIVICDFLVSAMLSMMTGMVPAHTGGTGVGLDEQTTRVLLAEMNESLAQLERMRELLREAARKNGGASPEQAQKLRELAQQIIALRRDAEMLRASADNKDLAKLTAKQLQQRLEAELRRRLQAEMERNENSKDLSDREKELRDLRKSSQDMLQSAAQINANLSRSNAELASQNAEVSRKLAKSGEELRRAEKALSDEKTRRELADSKREAAEAREKGTRDDLARTKEALRNINARNARAQADVERNKAMYYAAKRELNQSEKEGAKLKDRLAAADKRTRVLELELEGLQATNRDLKAQVKGAIAESRQTRRELEKEKIASAKAETAAREKDRQIADKNRTIETTRKQLDEANKKLRNRLLQCYGDGAVKLTVDIREALMLGREQRGGGTYYLPLVEIGGRTFLVGHTNQFLGDPDHNSLMFSDVKQVAISVSIPGDKRAAALPIKGPVLLADREPRLAAVPIKIPGRRPLQLLTSGELRERGVGDLFLVKAGSPGSEYAALGERCSTDISGDLFIRNAGSRSELRAEPGDLILTKGGEFVGVVTEVASVSGSRRHGDRVRVFTIPDGKLWDAPKFTIVYTRPKGAEYFTGFEESARRIRGELEPAKRRRRRR